MQKTTKNSELLEKLKPYFVARKGIQAIDTGTVVGIVISASEPTLTRPGQMWLDTGV